MKDTKILVIDDNPKNIQIAMSILSQAGYSLLYAQDGKKGIELAKNQSVALILLDILMPGMDGFEVCLELKGDEATKDIPIIFLTVKDDEDDMVKGFDCGGVDYITKPFFEKVLLKRVETQLKLVETTEKLKDLNRDLSKKVEEKVERLRQKDQILFQQAKMASMGEMIANIAHQWRQPLSAISSSTLAIKAAFEMDRFSLKDEAKECKDFVIKKIDDIDDYVEVLANTIDDFKNFFKPQKKKEIFDLEDAVEKSLKIFFPSIAKSDIAINNEIASVMLVSYSNELIQVLINILNNAREALLEDENNQDKKIILTSYVKGDFVNISIKDNGPGISEDIIDKVFEPYFTTKEEFGGTGIGLYMAKEIVQKHLDGDLRVKRLKKGTEFIISLPIEREL